MARPLTDIPGIGPTMASRLEQHGIASLEAFAMAKPKDLTPVQGIGLRLADTLLAAAATLLGGVVAEKPQKPARAPKKKGGKAKAKAADTKKAAAKAKADAQKKKEAKRKAEAKKKDQAKKKASKARKASKKPASKKAKPGKGKGKAKSNKT